MPISAPTPRTSATMERRISTSFFQRSELGVKPSVAWSAMRFMRSRSRPSFSS